MTGKTGIVEIMLNFYLIVSVVYLLNYCA